MKVNFSVSWRKVCWK